MHQIERLLQTLAPKGVGFKTLEEVFEIRNGYTPSKNNPEFWKNGTIPWFRMEDLRENGRILKDSIQRITPKALKGKKLFPKNSIIISTTATIGEHALLIVDSLANQQFTFLSKKANCDIALDMKFFFYQCFLLGEWCKNNTNVSGFASVDMTAFKKYKFPIPPLEIQQEIVKILDAFTELKARKKQYQYYQNMLLDFNDINQNHKDAKMSAKTYPKRLKTLLQTLAPKGVGFKTLEEVFEIRNGYTPSKNNPEFWKNGTIPWFRMEDLRENGRILKDSIQRITPKALKGKKLFPKNSIIISTTATIGEHALLIVDSLANQQFTFLSKKANCDIALDMKFFFYQCFLLGEWCKNNTNVSGFASVDMTAFKKYKFPIPPLEIQQEIVKILDAFTELNTELNTELKARKKQYQYYQNMLLDFNDINQNHKDAKMSAKT
ncbi:restriction endonuclease subunit S [Helicobacter pylori]|nr:restriction endonuclease subunit S [Helicobacter pylori]